MRAARIFVVALLVGCPSPEADPEPHSSAEASAEQVEGESDSPKTPNEPQGEPAKPKPKPAQLEGPRRPLVIITIDTLRADRLGTYGYFRNTSPNIDKLAKQSLVFTRAVTPMATTLPAHTSIMTGTRPLRHRVFKNSVAFEAAEDLQPLAEKLREQGYRTAAFVSATPVSAGTGIETGFDHFDDPTGASQKGEVTTEKVEKWLKATENETGPFFLWVHYWDVHGPYEPLEQDLKELKGRRGLKRYLKKRGVAPVKHIGNIKFDVIDINDRYDGEVRHVDREIGRLVDALKLYNLFDKATIVLTADHGEGLFQHDWLDHGQIFNEQIFVPLMIKPSLDLRKKPARFNHMASTIDLLPTLFAMVELPFDSAFQSQLEGMNLLSGAAKRRSYVFSERVHVHRKGWDKGWRAAWTGRRWKYFAKSHGEHELYDLRRDRYELKNVAKRNKRLAAQLKQKTYDLLASYAKEPAERKPVNEELMSELRSLGYLE